MRLRLINNVTSFVRQKRDWILDYNARKERVLLKDKLRYRLKILYLACKRFYDNSLFSKDVGALTYATFMSLVPLVAVLFAVARMCGLDEVFVNWLATVLNGQPEIAENVVALVHNYLANTSNQAIILVGVALMLYPLYSLMNKIDISWSGIWGVSERKLGLRLVRDYVLLYLVFLVLLILTLFVNLKAYLLLDILDGYDLVGDMASLLMPAMTVLPLTIFFLVMFCYIPNTKVELSRGLVPSLTCAILIEALKSLYIYAQVFLTSYNVIYGSLAVLPLFLLWLQCVWVIIEFCVAWCCAAQNVGQNPKDILLLR